MDIILSFGNGSCLVAATIGKSINQVNSSVGSFDRSPSFRSPRDLQHGQGL